MPTKLTVTHLSHDLAARKSYVSIIWPDDASKRLGLEVPFGTSLDDVEAAARAALTGLSRELDASTLTVAPDA